MLATCNQFNWPSTLRPLSSKRTASDAMSCCLTALHLLLQRQDDRYVVTCAVGIRSDELQYRVQNIGSIHWRGRMNPVVIIVTVVGEGGNGRVVRRIIHRLTNLPSEVCRR